MLRPLLRAACGLALSFALAGVAGAADPATAMCIKQANDDYKACSTVCKDDRKNDQAVCRGRDPGCVATCRDGRNECTAPYKATLDACLDACEPIVDAARPGCKADAGCGGSANPCGFNPAYIACLNPAQTLAFQCRNLCRDTYRLDGSAAAVKACQEAYRDCARSCVAAPPAP